MERLHILDKGFEDFIQNSRALRLVEMRLQLSSCRGLTGITAGQLQGCSTPKVR